MLYGEPVVGSDFDAIFQAAFTGNSLPDLPGTDSFFRGLRTMRVSKNALSSRNFVKAYGSTPRRTGPLQHSVLALDEEDDEEEPSAKREREDDFKTPRRSEPALVASGPATQINEADRSRLSKAAAWVAP